MEKYKCKLCLKNFANGRALGGHMRSHMVNLYVNPRTQQTNWPAPEMEMETETETAFSSSSSEDEVHEEEEGVSEESQEDYEEEEEEEGLFGNYGSKRLVDEKFSTVGAAAVVLQDRESETESSRNATARRRSKRIRKSGTVFYETQRHYQEKPKFAKLSPSWVDPEPVSSISDTTPEEDIAYCLMMLSRDKWVQENQEQGNYEEDEDEESEGEVFKVKRNRTKAKYRCETCNRVFRSYQALGGHRASHKKIKLIHHLQPKELEDDKDTSGNAVVEQKTHECPVCFRVFASGQALGGHKRSHVTTSSVLPAMAAAAKPVSSKQSENNKMAMIDLNLPAPVDDDDQEDGVSQNELSVVSDGEFVKTH